MRRPEQDDLTYFDGIGLDDVTVARLIEVCEAAKAPPKAVIAAIVRDVLEDDALQSADAGAEIITRRANHDLH